MVKIEDIYDIIKKPEVKNYNFLFLSLIIVFILSFIIYFIFRKYILNKKLSPDQEILKDLKSLEKQIIQEDHREKNYRDFYEQLSQLIKRYFFKKTGDNCVSMSDREFCNYLSINKFNINLNKDNLAQLINIISNFQEIKYARIHASKQQILDDISKINLIIKNIENIKTKID